MSTQSSSRTIGSLQVFSWVSSALVVAAGCVVLVGWLLDVAVLKSVLPGTLEMKANTALSFVLAGLSLGMLRRRPAVTRPWRAAEVCALMVALIGLLTLAEYVFQWDLGIDQLAFKEPAGAVGTTIPGRMAPNTALCFVLVGLALLRVDRPGATGLFQGLAIAVGLMGLLALVGYVYGTKSFYGIGSYTAMAAHTATLFSVLALGLLAARPDCGLMAIVTSESMGGAVARRLLPAAIVVPAALEWLRRMGQQVGLYSPDVGLALFQVAIILVFTALILRNASLLMRVDAEREMTDEALRRAHDELETRVKDRTRDLTQLLVEIRAGITLLATTANEVLATAAQLASSAAKAAASVYETTTMVEEVRQTAQVASQKAKAVADSAQQAEQFSQSGRNSAADVVIGMNQVHQQMETIAASMMRLTEQSETIGQIIATVEDLAAQSNLLAVNAAIEAANAGEHGKGFRVVAQEMKSLAEQSRQATNQVRTILGDVQKATTAAVLATEQGGKLVEAGTPQTEAARESIQALTESVTEAAQAARQIKVSSQQQLVGVDLVAAAMESINQASTHTLAGAKQLETAARNLDELGQRLKQMVEKYTV